MTSKIKKLIKKFKIIDEDQKKNILFSLSLVPEITGKVSDGFCLIVFEDEFWLPAWVNCLKVLGAELPEEVPA